MSKENIDPSGPQISFGRGPHVSARAKPEKAPVVRRRPKATAKGEPQPGSGLGDNITHPSVAFLFDPERDSKLPAPYWQISDDEMHTPGAIAQREELRSHPAVQDGLRRLAKYAFTFDEQGLVDKTEYLRVHKNICKILAPKMHPTEAAAAAEAEWAADAGEGERMDASMLNAALFQLTDVWCQTLEAEEYLSFLEAAVAVDKAESKQTAALMEATAAAGRKSSALASELGVRLAGEVARLEAGLESCATTLSARCDELDEVAGKLNDELRTAKVVLAEDIAEATAQHESDVAELRSAASVTTKRLERDIEIKALQVKQAAERQANMLREMVAQQSEDMLAVHEVTQDTAAVNSAKVETKLLEQRSIIETLAPLDKLASVEMKVNLAKGDLSTLEAGQAELTKVLQEQVDAEDDTQERLSELEVEMLMLSSVH
eukprot:SAG31_NODE_6180_length_2135_cov_1.055010_2_plen_433_part_00